MAEVVVEIFSWHECAICKHRQEDHHDHLPHYGCGCVLSQYRRGGEFTMQIHNFTGRWIRFHTTEP
jgi:hypothetical protein